MDEWKFRFDDWNPEDQQIREALCTLGNGYWGTRGAAEEARQEGSHYPGTYVAGAYDRLERMIAGKPINHEVLVNWPNWLFLTFTMENGSWFDMEKVEIRNYWQELNLQQGLLTRYMHVVEPEGRETILHTSRLVHMEYPHLGALRWTLTPQNWSGRIQVRSALDARIINENVERDGEMREKHFQVLEAGVSREGRMCVVTKTPKSHLRMAQGIRNHCSGAKILERNSVQELDLILEEWVLEVEHHSALEIEKVAAIYQSRDQAIFEPLEAVHQALDSAGNFHQLLSTHQQAWKKLWEIGDIRIQSRAEDQLMLRLYLFHLLQTASPHLADLDAGLPGRGLAGEKYQGHIFWDEVFAFPFLNLRMPNISRALLQYRARRESGARIQATQRGAQGIAFPWRSASNGLEQTPRLQWNPHSRHWMDDHTHLQCHQNAAIVYEIWRYYQATADLDFLQSHGARVILQLALFWSSMAKKDPETGRYHIHGVMGPDEFHTGYPNASHPGLNDNAYTNIMAVWTLRCTRHVLEVLPQIPRHQLLEELTIDHTELTRWENIIRQMYVPFHDDGIISQFAGYELLQELDWDTYRSRYRDIRRLDQILEAEGDSINRYKVSKQPDVLMVFYLLSLNDIDRMFSDLGYSFSLPMLKKNIVYYQQRTTHGSTLSRIVFSWILARSDRKGSWQYLIEALGNDTHEIKGGSTGRGIHLGAMAGSVDLIQRCYGGIEVENNMLWLNPRLPESLQGVAMNLYYRHHHIHLQISPESLSIQISSGPHFPIVINVHGKVYSIDSTQKQEFPL